MMQWEKKPDCEGFERAWLDRGGPEIEPNGLCGTPDQIYAVSFRDGFLPDSTRQGRLTLPSPQRVTRSSLLN